MTKIRYIAIMAMVIIFAATIVFVACRKEEKVEYTNESQFVEKKQKTSNFDLLEIYHEYHGESYHVQNNFYIGEDPHYYEWTRNVDGAERFHRANVYLDEDFAPVAINMQEDGRFQIETEQGVIDCFNLDYSNEFLSFNFTTENGESHYCKIFSSLGLLDALDKIDVPFITDFPNPGTIDKGIITIVVTIAIGVAAIGTAVAIHYCQQQIDNDVEKCHAKGCLAHRNMCSAECYNCGEGNEVTIINN